MTTDTKPVPDATEPQPDNTDTSPASGTVPASDLMALKRSHETKAAELTAQIAKLTAEAVSLRAATTAAESRAEEQKAKALQLDDVTKQLQESRAQVETLTESSLSSRRKFLANTYGLKPEDLKDYKAEQLEALEAVLPSAAAKAAIPTPASLDGAGGTPGSSRTLSARDMIAQGLSSSP